MISLVIICMYVLFGSCTVTAVSYGVSMVESEFSNAGTESEKVNELSCEEECENKKSNKDLAQIKQQTETLEAQNKIQKRGF